MFCAISGVTPEDPVVSVKSGLLFERRLIEKSIEETGLCPVTGESLSVEDLVAVKSNKAVKPRPLQAASIPGMLTLFQNEWDALALRDYALEQQLNTAREELSHALYQSDAACRVIARLIRERDEARQLLAQAERQLARGLPAGEPAAAAPQPLANGKRAMEVDEEEDEKQRLKKARQLQGITDSIIADMTECNQQLSAQRKKRQISASLATAQQLEEYTQLSSHPLHKSTKPGILCLDILGPQSLIVTGGMDGAAVVFNKDKGEIVATLAGHSKRVTAVKFVPDSAVVISASADKTARVWKRKAEGEGEGAYECEHVLKEHGGEVKAISVHATNKFFVTASADKTWAVYDLESGACLTQVTDATVTEPYTAASFHPDGLILGTGSADSLVRIWDIKSQANVAKFEGHEGPVTSLHFSENGYFLATSASDGVKLWDLRKLKNFRSFPPDAPQAHTNTVRFDFSGSYLAAGGSEVRIFQVGSVRQDWPLVKTFPDVSGTGKVTCLEFGPDAAYLALGTMDRNLRIFGLPGGAGKTSEDGEDNA